MYLSTFNLHSALFLIAASACWGIATVITKHILTAIPPISLLVIQLIGSVSLLWPLTILALPLRASRPSLSEEPFFQTSPGSFHLIEQIQKHWIKVGWLGLLNPGISYTLSLMGLTTTTASMSTLLWASEPVLILLLAGWVLREKLTPKVAVFSLIAISGVVLTSGLPTQWSEGNLTGNLLILSGVLCCAFYTVLARRTGEAVEPLFAVTLQQTFALGWALMLLPFELTIHPLERLLQLDAASWFWAGMSGVLYYALAFWFYLNGLRGMNASAAGTFLNLIPIFGIGAAYIFLGEQLGAVQWIGAAAILLSVLAIWFWGDQGKLNQFGNQHFIRGESEDG